MTADQNRPGNPPLSTLPRQESMEEVAQVSQVPPADSEGSQGRTAPKPMTVGDRVMFQRTNSILDGHCGTIAAPTIDGPWDWWVELDRHNPKPFLARESELVRLS